MPFVIGVVGSRFVFELNFSGDGTSVLISNPGGSGNLPILETCWAVEVLTTEVDFLGLPFRLAGVFISFPAFDLVF